MSFESAVEADGLRKSYGKVPVLSGVDLRVRRGSVFALLGPNGAGKTTTVRVLATLLRADAGTAKVAGFDVADERVKVRRSISLTGQSAALDALQTGAENLQVMCRLAGLRRAEARTRARDLLERFDLAEAGGRRVHTYSGGMRRRLDLAASLCGNPSVIFLDEPTTGLDPRSRQTMWDVIMGFARSGVTIFLTTQYLEEADRLAERVAVLDGGKVVADDTPAGLKARFAERRLDLLLASADAYEAVAARLGGRTAVHDRDNHRLSVPTDGDAAHVRHLLDELDPDRTAIRDFTVHTATLDDVFLALTGRTASAGPEDPDDATRQEPHYV